MKCDYCGKELIKKTGDENELYFVCPVFLTEDKDRNKHTAKEHN